MTALALNYSQKLTHLIEVVLKVVKKAAVVTYKSVVKTLEGMMIGYMLARQSQANYYIATKMLHEYPGHTVESLHAELNRKTLNSITERRK